MFLLKKKEYRKNGYLQIRLTALNYSKR